VDTDPRSLIAFVDASPTPFHVCRTAAERLVAAGAVEADERLPLPVGGVHLLIRGGTLIAWRAPVDGGASEATSYRIVAAHTDSPNLRIKPRPDVRRAGLHQLGVEVYGAPLLNSWLDRDLGLAGRVAVRTADAAATRLFRIDRPLLRIPQLAIHLDRDIGTSGLVLDRQQHLSPFWALDAAGAGEGTDSGGDFAGVLAAEVGAEPGDLIGWDAMVFPVEPSRLVGLHEEFVSAPRLDNQLSCWAGVSAFAARAGHPAEPGVIEVLVLFDHEEVGSASDRGAAGGFLGNVLERIGAAAGLDRTGFLAALARSILVSSDGSHATNPNYAERHEPQHWIRLDGGPVLKINANLRYATDAPTAAVFAEACARAGVPLQRFVNRTDLPCGSTIGPLSAAALGVPTVDVGAPQLAMHSARELCGATGTGQLARALQAFWAG
jgi:aspartyl aminopeptidase